jgi:hypothetical protein
LQVQLVKAALPAGELELDGQALHFELSAAPSVVEYVPVPQSVQVAVPVNALYFPATHCVHEPPFDLVDPVLQVQLVKAALPAGELEFDGQAMHVELTWAPTAVEYLPAPQFMQAALPAGEYVPAPQFVQVAVPVNVLYFPARHGSHGPPFGPVDPALQVQLVPLTELRRAGELEFVGQSVHLSSGEATFQEATNPDETTLGSDSNSTCMYPVLDRNSVFGLTESPDSFATRSKHTFDVQRHMVTKSLFNSVSNDENVRLIKRLSLKGSTAIKNVQ